MTDSRFVYVIYVRTTLEKLWLALIEPEYTRQYWFGMWQDCEWKVGAPWKLMIPDGRVGDSGEVLEIDPPRRLVLSWRNEFLPDLREEGYSRLTYTLEPGDGPVTDESLERTALGAAVRRWLTCILVPGDASVKLTVVHEIGKPDSKLIGAVSAGWPHLLSSMKSLLETGESLQETRRWPGDV